MSKLLPDGIDNANDRIDIIIFITFALLYPFHMGVNIHAPQHAGNHDWAVTGQFSIHFFNPYAKEAVLWTRKALDKSDCAYLDSLALTYQTDDFCLVHGTPIRPREFRCL